ncbi:MAG: hypothetical protein Q3998_07745, partial [Porphyromonas sp.]|nr:hypothetical protein [Porphyromonas sp.]
QGDKGDQGNKGDQGSSGAPGDKIEIIEGYWYINGINTGVLAAGEKGDPGKGKSAYEIWIEEVEKGTIFDKNGEVWDRSRITMNDFMIYMRGESGSSEVKVTRLSILKITPGGCFDTTAIPSGQAAPGKDNSEEKSSPCTPTKIEVQSDPNATIYYQVIITGDAYSGIGETSDTDVFEIVTDEAGKATVTIYRTETLVVNIWALAKGKAYSQNMLVRVRSIMSILT